MSIYRVRERDFGNLFAPGKRRHTEEGARENPDRRSSRTLNLRRDDVARAPISPPRDVIATTHTGVHRPDTRSPRRLAAHDGSPMSNIQQVGDTVLANVERVIVGKHQEVRLALVALMCHGHLLIEDVPGIGKTMLAKAHRPEPRLHVPAHPVHARPAALGRDGPLDLQPEDAGVRVPAGPDHEPGRPRRRDQPGDPQDPERAPRVHGGAPGDDRRRHAPDAGPFLVIATQNPIEYEGTFALPEAQLDRFMLRIRLGYPQPLDEIVILDEQKRTHPLEDLQRGLLGRRAARPPGERARGLRRPGGQRLHRAPGLLDAVATPTSTWARARAARSRSTGRPRRWRG